MHSRAYEEGRKDTTVAGQIRYQRTILFLLQPLRQKRSIDALADRFA